jgi:hypothetical protein
MKQLAVARHHDVVVVSIPNTQYISVTPLSLFSAKL